MNIGYNNFFIKNKNNTIIGVNLGSGFCAEHQQGIEDIKTAFGIGGKCGVEARKITKIPQKLIKIKEDCICFCHYKCLDEEQILRKCQYGNKPDQNNKIGSCWSKYGFAFYLRKKYIIDRFWQAFMKKDIVITIGGGKIFQNDGLNIIIYSQIDKETKEKVKKDDLDYLKLIKKAEDTNIYKKIHESKYYALSPRWKTKNIKSKYNVMFWLNPRNQEKNNYGWFSVEELEDWAQGKGKIPKQNKLLTQY